MLARRLASLALGSSLALFGLAPAVVAGPAPAQAAVVASPVQSAALKKVAGVTINKVGTRYVSASNRYLLKPSVKAKGRVVIAKKTVSVKRGSTWVAKNVTRVKLAPGTYRMTTKVTYRSYKVVSGKRVYAKAASFSASQKLIVKRPAKVASTSKGSCPSWAPIKANNNSGIYHEPGQRFYAKTTANVTCYASQTRAAKDGFRKSKV